jgi:trimethylamine--corrinoid protein Co-methyltransferase
VPTAALGKRSEQAWHNEKGGRVRQFAPPAEGRLEILTPDDLQRLDEAALHVLATTGVAVPALAARTALLAAGAQVDGQTVRIPADVVRQLVALAPASLTLGARAHRTLVTGEGSLLTTDGCPTDIYDLETGAKRPTTAADAIAITRIVDALDEVDFCWTTVSAQDRPVERRGLYEIYDVLANTGKHVQTVTIVDQAQARVAVEMARAIAGGDLGVRRAPPISALLGTITPLGHDEGTLDAAFVFAAAGVPIGFVTMPQGGSTTPVTMAGSLTVGIAEALSGVCAVQAAFPGAPVFICFIPSVMDLHTGDFSGGAPEDTLMAAAVGNIGGFYGLPTECGINASAAKLPGWQSVTDDVTTTYLSILAGVDMLTGVGMVAGGRIFSFEELILGTEVVAAARAAARAASAGRDDDGYSPDAGPLDMTRRLAARPVGSDAGSGAVHVAPHVAPRDGARDDGARDGHLRDGGARAAARALARDLLATHTPPALEQALDAELRRLVAG